MGGIRRRGEDKNKHLHLYASTQVRVSIYTFLSFSFLTRKPKQEPCNELNERSPFQRRASRLDVTLRSSRRHPQQRQVCSDWSQPQQHPNRPVVMAAPKTWPEYLGCRWTRLGETRGGKRGTECTYAPRSRRTTSTTPKLKFICICLLPHMSGLPLVSLLWLGLPCGCTHKGASSI